MVPILTQTFNKKQLNYVLIVHFLALKLHLSTRNKCKQMGAILVVMGNGLWLKGQKALGLCWLTKPANTAI